MALDTSYRSWPRTELVALKMSILTQLKNIEGTGQSHGLSGRSASMADFKALTETLANVNAAISFIDNTANTGNTGYASRYPSFGA